MKSLFNSIYNNRRVLITGHSGFKGSWLALWLQKMNAEVAGYSLEPPTTPSHFKLLNLDMQSTIGDIRDRVKFSQVIEKFQPEIIFHLAAQPLVRESYRNPIETYETNVMGTLNLLEISRTTQRVNAIVNVTTDKCYKNNEWLWGYRENEPMGGHDPYSSSKACSEILTESYRTSFFPLHEFGTKHNVLLASARSGNVIGGGDWAEDRLIPDIMRAASENKTVTIRNPIATRPWQHVLDPLFGYLKLGQKLLEKEISFAEAWNFGPSESSDLTVEDVTSIAKKIWDKCQYKIEKNETDPHEATLLKLDSSKARKKLGWNSMWDSSEAIKRTIDWYSGYYTKNGIKSIKDLEDYVHLIEK